MSDEEAPYQPTAQEKAQIAKLRVAMDVLNDLVLEEDPEDPEHDENCSYLTAIRDELEDVVLSIEEPEGDEEEEGIIDAVNQGAG